MSPNPIQSILPLELLLKYNFFDLYPFDGGGSFIHRKYIHSIDDIKGAENILNGAINEFGSLENIDFAKFEYWNTIEQSCWINRMYFIMHLAKYANVKKQ